FPGNGFAVSFPAGKPSSASRTWFAPSAYRAINRFRSSCFTQHPFFKRLVATLTCGMPDGSTYRSVARSAGSRPGIDRSSRPAGRRARAIVHPQATATSAPGSADPSEGGRVRMSWLKRALPAAAWAAVLTSSPAFAQISGHPIEVSGGAGILAFDTRARLHDAAAFTGSVGYRMAPWFTLEASALMASTKADTLPTPDA